MLDPIKVGIVIQRYREMKGLSQEQLSAFAGIGRTHLSAIECGARKPTMETLFRLCHALGVRPSVLVSEVEEEVQWDQW